ncbi:Rapid ALkalinization Factor [Dillenia turbinata]|uniref:Rapid ALkalinization Factor n=1 Tax=Dillenia turbinata TaxID=194707 RepID=A0AAN8UF90_9MAGN
MEKHMEMEMVMESEISRRFLEATEYITASAFKPDLRACGGNGARGGAKSATLCISVSLYSGAAKASQAIHAYATCNGSIAECNRGNELLMENEIVRRYLEGLNQISYRALDTSAVCDVPGGQPYRSCTGSPTHPGKRGCYEYYDCRQKQHT